ncbi:glycosyltransferase family 4 protein [Actinomadura napierensis]|uniref:Glycosyltransferase family 4 protein n=1 Tax=Actinomadura napierensis TaxID=267854 RepID=A0ABP5KXV7_9ACTN
MHPRPAPEKPAPSLDRLRVAMVNWRDPWQRAAGGAEEYAWQMSRQLRDRGARVHFVTSREAGQARREERDGIAISRMGGKYSRYPLTMAWLLRHRRDFDVVVDCMNGIPYLSPLVLHRRTRVLLLVHHVHGRQFFVYFPAPLAWLGKALEGPVARLVYRRHPAVAVSVSTATAMRERLGWRGPIFIVPNGAHPASPGPARGRRTSPDAAPGPVLACVGRLVTTKRVDEVIDVAARLRDRWPGLRLHVIGRGHEEPALAAQIAAAGLQDTVRLHGYLPAAGKDALLAGADLHITASRFEGWGLSVLEAASLGVPTVAHDVDGLREAVRHGVTGWLAGPDEDLAPVVERALKEVSDPVRRAEIRESCEHWAGLFSWTATGDRMARLIRAQRRVPPRRRPGGPAYVATFGRPGPAGAAERTVLVENTGPAALARAAAARGETVLGIRAATPTELLTGVPGREL